MRKPFYFAVSISVLLILSGCNKKNENKARVSVYGGSVAVGTALISPECGTTTTVSIYPQNTYQYGNNYNNGTYTTTVVNGGTFEFQLAPGNYIIQAMSNNGYAAGACQYSNIIYSTANTNVAANVCVGASVQAQCPVQQYNALGANQYGNQVNPYGVNPYAQNQYGVNPYGTGYVDPYAMQGPNCQWGTYGCMGYMYPGTGTVGVGKPNLYFYTSKKKSLSLDLEFKSGSNINAAAPGLGEKGWNIEIQPDGKIISLKDKTQWDYLYYEAQTHHSDLQMQEAYKVKREQVLSSMIEFLKNEGFNERTIVDFEKHNKNKTPPNEEFYIYPQFNAHIDPIVKYKSNINLVQKKIWFIIVPVMSQAQLKLKNVPSFFASQFDAKKIKTYAQNKKNDSKRNVANSDDVLVEEWGVGYLLEK